MKSEGRRTQEAGIGMAGEWMTACRENSMVGGATLSQNVGEMHHGMTFLTLGVSVIS